MKTAGKILLGHRGTSIMAPENTVPAFDFALQHGAHALETDVRLSRDGHIMVTHDDTVDRTTDGHGRVIDLTLDALRQLDAGYQFQLDGQYPHRDRGVRLITLAEMLQRYPQTAINIDIKDNLPQAADAVIKVVKDNAALQRTVLTSFHHTMVEHVRQRCPQATTGASMGDIKTLYGQYLLGRLPRIEPAADFLQLPPRYWLVPLASRSFINAIHQCNRQVHYWTINNYRQAQRLLTLGADGIVSDRADLLAPLFPSRRPDH